ncbi:MAG: hypothetical protein R2706_10450 [Acidimicrobiales bacterium]
MTSTTRPPDRPGRGGVGVTARRNSHARKKRERFIAADPANAAAIESAFDNDAFLRHLDRPARIVEPDEILVDAINLGAFLHSGTEAIEFIGLLPTANTRGVGIDI